MSYLIVIQAVTSIQHMREQPIREHIHPFLGLRRGRLTDSWYFVRPRLASTLRRPLAEHLAGGYD